MNPDGMRESTTYMSTITQRISIKEGAWTNRAFLLLDMYKPSRAHWRGQYKGQNSRLVYVVMNQSNWSTSLCRNWWSYQFGNVFAMLLINSTWCGSLFTNASKHAQKLKWPFWNFCTVSKLGINSSKLQAWLPKIRINHAFCIVWFLWDYRKLQITLCYLPRRSWIAVSESIWLGEHVQCLRN